MTILLAILPAFLLGVWLGWCLRRDVTPPVFQPVLQLKVTIVPEMEEDEYEPGCN